MKKKYGILLASVIIILMSFSTSLLEVKADSFTCGDWISDGNGAAFCSTPLCSDSATPTQFLEKKRHRVCYYSNGYTFTIPDTYKMDLGCC